MKISKFFIVLLLIGSHLIIAQNKPSRPKLVVGIVVDQMRYDYLYRFANRYGENGLKRMMREGLNCQDNHYNYAPTVTAAGHASVYTGTVPAVHGIVGNEWMDRATGKRVYCTDDSTVTTIGTTGKTGKMSPKNLWTSTITDQLKISQNYQSKTIAIALKDRGAILPGGHTADAAYWYDSKEGRWITSSFYMKELPTWVQGFNAEERAQKFTKLGWNTLYPLDTYRSSASDNVEFESKMAGETAPVFPHTLQGGNPLELIRTSPYGNTLTKDFAIKAMQEEQLGKRGTTDFLAISFSSTDYVGHSFGPQSIELEDTYLRLDRDIAEILTFLDKQYGKDQVLVFLTADHAVAEIPGFIKSKKLPGGIFDRTKAVSDLNKALNTAYGDVELLIGEDNSQLHFNAETIKKMGISRTDLFQVVRRSLDKQDGFADLIDLQAISQASIINHYKNILQHGYNPARSGDFMLLLKPQWLIGYKTGTSHSTVYAYDTHVPLLFYGWKVKPQEISTRTEISDIAPTIANWLNCMEPSGSMGRVIQTK
jgi:predicted AlkP superfamily pyrophosphatase or phosphodiesterase